MMLIGCGSSGNQNNHSRQTATGNSNASPSTISDINAIPGKDLSTASKVLKAINDLPDVEPIPANWIHGEWVSYDSKGISYKTTFNADGSYKTEITVISKGKSTTESKTGKWRVYQKTGNTTYQLFITSDGNPYSVENYPMEQEGADGFRIVHSYQIPLARSRLYSRADTDIAIYPGMFLLGTYTYNPPARSFNEFRKNSYTLRKDGSFKMIEKVDVINLSEPDVHEVNQYDGRWRLDTGGGEAKLIVTFDDGEFTFKIDAASTTGLSLDNQSLYWEKVDEGKLRSSVAHMEGEYQSSTGEDYFSIHRDADGYLVDFVSNYFPDTSFKNLPATVLPNGDLQLITPEGHIGAGSQKILRMGYNRLIMLKGFDGQTDKNMQKISHTPIAHTSTPLLGAWRDTISALRVGQMGYINFYQDGTYKYTHGYGTYTFDSQTLKMDETCQESKIYHPTFADHKLDLDINRSAVPGLRDWGESGSKVGEYLFKHALDVYQLQKSPKLKAHPGINGVYVFAKAAKFRALNGSGSFTSFSLEADGTGSYHIGNTSRPYLENGYWQTLPNDGLGYGIKYFILQEAGKEYIVYYPRGIAISYDNSNFNFIAEVKNEYKENVRVVELYHRRTAICEDGNIVVPLDRS